MSVIVNQIHHLTKNGLRNLSVLLNKNLLKLVMAFVKVS